MSSVIALNQIDGSELWKKVGFKPSEKVLVALRGVYNLPFNLDDPVLRGSWGFYQILRRQLHIPSRPEQKQSDIRWISLTFDYTTTDLVGENSWEKAMAGFKKIA